MMHKLAYTVAEVMDLTGIGRSALYKEISAGNLVARKRGSQTLILASELETFLTNLPKFKAGERA